MEAQRMWHEVVPQREGSPSVIWSMAFSPDGSRLLVAAGSCLLVYDSTTGKILQTLKSHRDSVYVVAYSKSGKLFASGGADRAVIIWTEPGEGWRKYTHSDSIQCLAFNPVTLQLASATAVDLGLWSPELSSVGKQKLPSKACCMDWTPDGNLLALGLYSGVVSVRDTTGAEKWSVALSAPVWTLAWSPDVAGGSSPVFLAVGSFSPELVFYRATGETCFKPQSLACDPLSISFAQNGNFFVVGGSDGSVSIWSHEGVWLGPVSQMQDWVWASAVHPSSSQIVAGSNAGEVDMYKLVFPIVHGLYQERYAHRDRLTEVVIQHMRLEQSVRIRCRSLVKKVAVFKESLAILLSGEVVIYSSNPKNPDHMNYQETHRIKQPFDCSLMLVTSTYLVRCTKAKLQLYTLSGHFEREWNLGSVIRYIKVVGGPPAAEGILAGLKNGEVVQIFTNNPFPVTLVKQAHAIACLDVSLLRTKLAAVDSTQRLTVYDLATKEVLFVESNVTSVAWNMLKDDMLAFAGNNTLSIRCGSLEPWRQRVQGFVIGCRGSQVYCLKSHFIQTCDFPQSASLYPYLARKNFAAAYEVACLGVTTADWILLALSALASLDFVYARKAFSRIRDFRGLRLVQQAEGASTEDRTLSPEQRAFSAAAAVAAFRSSFDEAAQCWWKAGQAHLAVEMFTDLRRGDDAKKWAAKAEACAAAAASRRDADVEALRTDAELDFQTGDHGGAMKSEIQKFYTYVNRDDGVALQPVRNQAASAEGKKDLLFAAEMYSKAKQFRRAVELYGQSGALDKIILIVRGNIPTAEAENVLRAALGVFKEHRHFAFGRETAHKLGDKKSLVCLLAENGRWEEAFLLAQQRPDVQGDVYIRWADHLIRADRFDEAADALKASGRSDVALFLQIELLAFCVEERMFREAARRAWSVAAGIWRVTGRGCSDSPEGNAASCQPSLTVSCALYLFCVFRKLAEIYLAYHVVLRRNDGILPYTARTQSVGTAGRQDGAVCNEIVFNAACFLWSCAVSPLASARGGTPQDPSNRQQSRHDAAGDKSGRDSVAEAARPSTRILGGTLGLEPTNEELASSFAGEMGRIVLNRVCSLRSGGPVPGVSQVEVLYALAETSLQLRAYKVGRFACHSLQRLRVSDRMQEVVDCLTLALKAAPRAKEDHTLSTSTCAWCRTPVPLLASGRLGFPYAEACGNCGHLRLREFGGFSVVNCIEFLPPLNVTGERAKSILSSTKINSPCRGHPFQQDRQRGSFLTEARSASEAKEGLEDAHQFVDAFLEAAQAGSVPRPGASLIPPRRALRGAGIT
ncbi:WD domain, G-beta repeat-containing protein [Besnoitia besnoiti]|uniref:Intraflagellar transport protein 122 homolog n=1 Tax=Besnoitia besnoiti TaxID=94643 RepID=A0A2A9MNZ4_BESBE|nr:WD domain, G-beta repeat-containing protein [Besnoitia besnoiti]PFH37462.1 WD domain, G-beta repeat-containing protein [Besnoitia besnoiti]